VAKDVTGGCKRGADSAAWKDDMKRRGDNRQGEWTALPAERDDLSREQHPDLMLTPAPGSTSTSDTLETAREPRFASALPRFVQTLGGGR
jgi:hypothetical protein